MDSELSGNSVDYINYYSREKHLFENVGPRFRKSRHIDSTDFYLILIWKAERAKTRHKIRLAKLAKKTGGFSAAVEEIAASLHAARGPQDRLKILMQEWKFRLPTASAILTVLYPEEFTVYDVRICDELQGFHKLANRCVFSDKLWADYQDFIRALKAATPEGLSLRDADRYLWGKSVYKSIQKDLRA